MSSCLTCYNPFPPFPLKIQHLPGTKLWRNGLELSRTGSQQFVAGYPKQPGSWALEKTHHPEGFQWFSDFSWKQTLWMVFWCDNKSQPDPKTAFFLRYRDVKTLGNQAVVGTQHVPKNMWEKPWVDGFKHVLHKCKGRNLCGFVWKLNTKFRFVDYPIIDKRTMIAQHLLANKQVL